VHAILLVYCPYGSAAVHCKQRPLNCWYSTVEVFQFLYLRDAAKRIIPKFSQFFLLHRYISGQIFTTTEQHRVATSYNKKELKQFMSSSNTVTKLYSV